MTDLVHEPLDPVEACGTRTLSGRVRPADATVNAYLLALTRYEEWVPPIAHGYVRADQRFEQSPCGGWCSYRITDRLAHTTLEHP